MNEQEMTFHLTEISRKDDEIYLLNVECEELQTTIGDLQRTIEEMKEELLANTRMDR